MKFSLMQAMMAEMLNFSLCLMSAWMVGKVEAPAKANITEPKACKHFSGQSYFGLPV